MTGSELRPIPLTAAPGPQTREPSPSSVGRYNTQQLPSRVATDATAAASAASLIAPVITIIDRAIIENASGRSPLVTSLRTSFHSLFTRPHLLIISRPFRLIFTLYFGTYMTANTIDTLTTTLTPCPPSPTSSNPKSLPAPPSLSATTSGPAKFLATSSVNLSLCLYKDSQFTRLFGPLPTPGTILRAVPPRSYAVFALRDALTIFASFNLPPLLTPYLGGELHGGQWKAQMLAPAAMQVFSTPLHLLGLDFYNRPGRVGSGDKGTGPSWNERWRTVKAGWGMSALARMGRIVPAFGIGGVINAKVRREGMGRLESESGR